MGKFGTPAWHPEQVPDFAPPAAWRTSDGLVTEDEAAAWMHAHHVGSTTVVDLDGRRVRATAVDEFVILEAA